MKTKIILLGLFCAFANFSFAGNTKQRLDSLVTKNYNSTNDTWENSIKLEYMYEGNNIVSQETSYKWDKVDLKWEQTFKTNSTYNSDGLLIKKDVIPWDTINGNWKLVEYSEVFTYNDNKKIIEHATYFIDLENTELYEKYEFEYDENGKLKTKIWSSGSYEFMNRSNYIYSNNKLTEMIVEFKSDANSEFYNNKKFVFNYNENGLLINEEEFYTEDQGLNWKGINITERSYDEYDNLIEVIYKSIDIYTLEVTVRNKEVKTFDNNYSYNDLILPSDYIGGDLKSMFSHQLLEDKRLNSGLIAEENKIFYYSLQTVSSNANVSSNNIEVYPNPSSENIMVSVVGNESFIFTLSDLQGKTVLTQQISGLQKINICALKTGAYLYTIANNETSLSGKLIKN